MRVEAIDRHPDLLIRTRKPFPRNYATFRSWLSRLVGIRRYPTVPLWAVPRAELQNHATLANSKTLVRELDAHDPSALAMFDPPASRNSRVSYVQIPPTAVFEFQQTLSLLPGRFVDAYFALVPNGARLRSSHTQRRASIAVRAQAIVDAATAAGSDVLLKVMEAFLRDDDAGRFENVSTEALRTALLEARLIARESTRDSAPSEKKGNNVNAFTGEPNSKPHDRRTVFLVQGRYHEANEALTNLLTSLDLRVVPWEEVVNATGVGNPYIGDVLKRGMEDATAIVVLFTAEEKVQLDAALVPKATSDERRAGRQPRPNVLIEAGMALAAYPSRTLIVQFGDVRLATDLGGKHLFRIGGAGLGWRNDLVSRLESIGLEPNTSGNRYLTAGSFPTVT